MFDISHLSGKAISLYACICFVEIYPITPPAQIYMGYDLHITDYTGVSEA